MKMTDELKHADETERLLLRLRSRPFREPREPSQKALTAILQQVKDDIDARLTKRVWTRGAAAVLACVFLFIGFAFLYETPGGIADWRYSRAAGLEGTVDIPIGKTPIEAVQKFRQFDTMHVIRQERLNGGMLLFIRRFEQSVGTDLQIEFVRHTWLGWKWEMGGGFQISAEPKPDEALNYMSMPRFPGIQGPFPIVFGHITHESVNQILISVSGPNAGSYPAKIIEYEPGKQIWYVHLPVTAAAPYEIAAYNDQGGLIADKTFTDPRDFSTVKLLE